DKFLSLKDCAIERISGSNKPVVAVGGTAMYIKALLYGLFAGPGSDENIRRKLKEQIRVEGLGELHKRLERVDPVAAERIHPNDERRIIRALEVFELAGRGISSFQKQFDSPAPAGEWKIIGLRREKEEASGRINARVKKMIQAGLVDEVKALLVESKPLSEQACCAIGYAEIIEYINGRTGLDEAVEQIKINTRKFAKAQRTWFKTFKNVQWLDVGPDDSVENILKMI
ncbi:MAG: tRNA (adenosine(37)-N6)-dimethylallyltransferase MiaA, partial [Planctomycetes bacterium]|nr:tRNA (adenosine(37)-N6)-dimethylallyltransferase MiaA [Planctomycetota bacterium]